MNTAVTIPWAAVVEGREPLETSSRLPIVVTPQFEKRRGRSYGEHVAYLVFQAFTGPRPLALVRRGPSSTLAEVAITDYDVTVVLTSDENTDVRLQDAYPSAIVAHPELRHGEIIRTHVARHARFDPDERAFVCADQSEPAGVGVGSDSSMRKFARPEAWGFMRTNTSGTWHWSASEVFPLAGDKRKPQHLPIYAPRFRDELTDLSRSTPPRSGDPFRCLPQLLQLIDACNHDPGRPAIHQPAENNVRLLALALGRCRLFGVHVPADVDFTLSPKGFDFASRQLINDLHRKLDPLTGIKPVAVEESAYREESIALELLEARTDAHTTYLSLDEAYAAARHNRSLAVLWMSRRLNQVSRMIRLFDGTLQKNLSLLKPAASTFLLENWRRLLAPAFRDCPPWWLDGSLG